MKFLLSNLSRTTILFLNQSFLTIAFLFLTSHDASAQEYTLKSPDDNITVKVNVSGEVKWSASFRQEELLKESSLSLKIKNGAIPGEGVKVSDIKRNSVAEMVEAVVPVKNRYIENKYNELTLEFNGNYAVSFRAYNDGIAYRFETNLNEKEIVVVSENAEFNFAGNYRIFFPEEESRDFVSHYERSYKDTLIKAITDSQFCSLPVLLSTENNTKLLITDADLYDYPNMFLYGSGSNTFTSAFPKVILANNPVTDRNDNITELAEYIAVTKGKRTFPWRVFIIAENDKDLLESDMVYKLSSPLAIKDVNWIKPGKVAWDWWNALNIYGVDFQSGINTETYKYYIDFASQFGLEYIILDEGWSRTTHDLLHSNPDLNLDELFQYAKMKNVGIILWCLWNALDKDMNNILKQFAAWGAKGVKVDFMQRGDQFMVNYYERVAQKAAEHKLLVDFHGAYKPSGLNRKYPNVLSYEGVKGLEHNKWSDDISPGHTVTLPFIRMTAGPMDFTPGAIINANKENFRVVFSEPMSQGTRSHQAAMYVVYESPLQMLADNPSNYLKDTAYTKFISEIPTVWDKTIGLDSKVGEYVAVARKNGNNWYIGAMTNWDGREMEIPLSFLDRENYSLLCVEDGINADKHASDYKILKRSIKSTETLKINLAGGGGWAGILIPEE